MTAHQKDLHLQRQVEALLRAVARGRAVLRRPPAVSGRREPLPRQRPQRGQIVGHGVDGDRPGRPGHGDRDRTYPAPGVAYATTDDLVPDLLGFADDNWVDGTQSFVFSFLSNAVVESGYGLTTTQIHEFGHHFGMSHPHDGFDPETGIDFDATGPYYFAWVGDESNTVMSYIDVNWDFSQFDRDNAARHQAAGFIVNANVIAGRILAEPRRRRRADADLAAADACGRPGEDGDGGSRLQRHLAGCPRRLRVGAERRRPCAREREREPERLVGAAEGEAEGSPLEPQQRRRLRRLRQDRPGLEARPRANGSLGGRRRALAAGASRAAARRRAPLRRARRSRRRAGSSRATRRTRPGPRARCCGGKAPDATAATRSWLGCTAARSGQLRGDRALEERAEAGDPGRDPDLAEGAVRARGHARPLRRDDADGGRGERRVREPDPDAGEQEPGQEQRPAGVRVHARHQEQRDADDREAGAHQPARRDARREVAGDRPRRRTRRATAAGSGARPASGE